VGKGGVEKVGDKGTTATEGEVKGIGEGRERICRTNVKLLPTCMISCYQS